LVVFLKVHQSFVDAARVGRGFKAEVFLSEEKYYGGHGILVKADEDIVGLWLDPTGAGGFAEQVDPGSDFVHKLFLLVVNEVDRVEELFLEAVEKWNGKELRVVDGLFSGHYDQAEVLVDTAADPVGAEAQVNVAGTGPFVVVLVQSVVEGLEQVEAI